MKTPGLLISAPASGAGKTTVTLALARAFCARGVRVQCFKSGPDYIDPAFHAAATGRASVNLDSWAMGDDLIASLTTRAAQSDLVIAEGSMGLFDGVARPGLCGTGASADIAALMGWPVVLVINPAGQAQTAAAVAKGLKNFRADVRVAGVILNGLASARHEALVKAGMDAAGITVFGSLPRNAPITLPERHLGLVQAREHTGLDTFIQAASELVQQHVDLDAVFDAARSSDGLALSGARAAVTPPGQRIALAQDAAFSFVYPHVVEGWRDAGAEIIAFSPLADEPPDNAADVCWLPGGYPELHAGALANCQTFKASMQSFARSRPVHGECGGYMVMGDGLVDASGNRYPMLGLLGLETSFEKRRMHLGYRTAELTGPMPGLAPGGRLRGHEFHYATILRQSDAPLAIVRDANGDLVSETGSWRGNCSGTFFHVITEGA